MFNPNRFLGSVFKSDSVTARSLFRKFVKSHRPGFRKFAVLVPLGLLLQAAFSTTPTASAQMFNISVQQPIVRFFNINTVVSVPDGGTMSLGGISRSRQSSGSLGIPLIGTPPLSNRLLGSRFQSLSQSSTQSSVRVQILSLSELEADVLRSAESRLAAQQNLDVNGNADTQKKAAFLKKNLGRRKR